MRGRTYLTLTAPEVKGEASQKLHTIVLHKGQYFTKKLLVGHLPRFAEHPSPQFTQITYILDNPRILLANPLYSF